ncbi:hypothetical protein DIPPA_06244 [Diplonema papillatum]|nr:hypothetical protein DIPPA_06244 [Diplonema papillatum]
MVPGTFSEYGCAVGVCAGAGICGGDGNDSLLRILDRGSPPTDLFGDPYPAPDT